MKILTKTAFVCVLALGLSACQIKSNHGNQIADDEIHKLRTAAATKADIIEKFGTPTITSFYGQESWFYISRKQYYRAFFAPQVSSQEIVQMTFNGDKLDKISVLENTNNNITPVSDITPTEGQNMNVIKDFVDNMGKFSKKKKGR